MLPQTVISNLKKVDPDRYRSALFAEKLYRDRLNVLYAFHYELAKVPELVSEPMIGAIRYQWWRDAIEEIYSGKAVRAHEISTPLSEMLRETAISRFWVDRLIEGRERDIDPRPFENIEDAREYCRQTSGVLLQIAIKLTGGDPGNASEKLGEAWGLTGLARAWGYYHQSMLSQLEFSEICDAAAKTHKEAQIELGKIPPHMMPALAYTALVPKYLRRLMRAAHEPETQLVSYTPLLKQFRLLGAVMTGRL